MSESEKVQEMAKAFQKAMETIMNQAQMKPQSDLELASEPFRAKGENLESKASQVITPSAQEVNKKELLGFQTFCFLDKMFIDATDKPIEGIPFGSNSIIVGIPNTGKSLILMEIALQVANSGKKVCFCTSEEVWKCDTPRYDLENRFRERAKILGLNWDAITQNLFIIDTVSNAELRDFPNLISTYRILVEKEKIDLLLVDSLTMIEDNRSQVKYRLSEWAKYNQVHGITAIFVSQRSGEDADSIGSIAGNIGVSHIADILMCMDSKRLSSWDATIKMDTNSKQGEEILFFRILKNRISRYLANYKKYCITKDGLVRLTETENIKQDQKT